MSFDSSTQKFTEEESNSMQITVFSEASQQTIVDKIGASKGTFRFTAADSGSYNICLHPNSPNRTKTRSKIYFDIDYPSDEAVSTKELTAVTEITSVVDELRKKVKMIRSDMKLQRKRESELRELSEKINTDTYRYTLLQIFVLSKFLLKSFGLRMADETFERILCDQKASLTDCRSIILVFWNKCLITLLC